MMFIAIRSSADPPWLENEEYDVTGQPDTPGQPNVNQLKAVVRKLLADPFQFTFHREKRELSVYAITVAKSGLKLTKNDSNPTGLPTFRGWRPLGGLGSASNVTMAEFVNTLQANVLNRPVVDQTGLGSVKYDLTSS